MAFLTKDLLIVCQQHHPIMGGDIIFEIWSLVEGRPLCIFELPVSAKGFSMRFLKHPSSNNGRNCPTRYSKLFVPDPTIGILPISFAAVNSQDLESFTIVLSVHLFIRKFQSLMAPIRTSRGAVVIFNWEQWGPSVTRWLPLEVRGYCGSRTVDGSRMLASLVRLRDFTGELADYNMLLDFNPRPIRRNVLEQCGDHVLISTVDYETGWHAYGRGVTSSLPYRAWVSTSPSPYLNLNFEANTILARLVGVIPTPCHKTTNILGTGERISLFLLFTPRRY